ERDVAEIPLVRHAIAAADARPAVAVHVPRKADARREVVPVLLPQRARRALVGGFRRARAYGVDDLGGRGGGDVETRIAVVEVRIVFRILLHLRPEVVIPDAEVRFDPARDAPVVLRVD